MLDATLDLLAGSRCLGCDRPGRPWCEVCAGHLRPEPWCCWPDPVPPGLLAPWAAADYAGPVRAMVLGHKERGMLSLTGVLGGLLAQAVRGLLAAEAGDESDRGSEPRGGRPPALLLVPVPSRAAGVRARGHDATMRMTRAGSRGLASPGQVVEVAPVLRLRPGVLDQSGLDAAGRAANLAGSMAADGAALRRLARRHERARVVVCDDVITTGATLREAQRALEASGVVVEGAGVVAATRRRRIVAPLLPSGLRTH